MSLDDRAYVQILVFSLIVVSCCIGWADDPPEIRAVYVCSWDAAKKNVCDAVIEKIMASNINAVFVQARARGDAFYFPNRESFFYPNPEPRGQRETISPPDFDPLQYFIDKLHNAPRPVEVHAWLTVSPIWSRSTPPSSPNHLVFTHPEWITESIDGTTIHYSDDVTAPIDFGIPEAREYLYNVHMDIVRNYDVDGIHFDYIRLLSSNSGYDPVAKARFFAETGWDFDTQNNNRQLEAVYNAWRRDQISRLVQDVHRSVMLEKPWVEVSAYLISSPHQISAMGQGFNAWVAHKYIDALHPGCYSSSATGTVAHWDSYIAKLAPNNDQYTRPLVTAIGSSYFVDYTGASGGAYDPALHTQCVTDLRSNSRPPDGFNFFAQAALFSGGVAPDPPDILAEELFGEGGPMDAWAPMPQVAHKVSLGEEALPPDPPVDLTVSILGDMPRITFKRPEPAADGDLPVHYRLYRDSDADVRLYYENMVMEWWDPFSARDSFSYDDPSASGTCYYAAVAYDDWNNSARAVAGPIEAATLDVPTIIIESHKSDGSVTPESEGFVRYGSGWQVSTAKSSAPGLVGLNTEWSSNASPDASYAITPNVVVPGYYSIYITTPSAASVDAANSTFRVVHANGETTGTIALTAANTGNVWTPLVSHVYLNAGNSASVTISEASPQANRFYADAVKFVAEPIRLIPKEPKPTSVPAALEETTEVIADSHPVSLDYDDKTPWTDGDFEAAYGGNCRIYRSAEATLVKYAIWIVDLPREGYWAIDGWTVQNDSLATHAKYMFVDGLGGVSTSIVTQRSATAGWNIDVDGVDDSQAYYFRKGRVYVTLYGSNSDNHDLLADAIRFRLVSIGTPTPGPTRTPTITPTSTPTNTPIPFPIETIIDDGDPGYEPSGNWTLSSSTDGYGGDYEYVSTSTSETAYAKWIPNLARAEYDVYVIYRQGSNRTTNGLYRVYYEGGSEEFRVNQQINGGNWLLLGRYPFASGVGGYVRLSNNTGETGRVVIADAVRFAPVATATPSTGIIENLWMGK